MDRHFWEIIDAARAHKLSDERLASIRMQLMNQPVNVLAEFYAAGFGWWAELGRKDLWAAAYTLLGGCSDDSFMDFRSWLLLQGRDAIEAVVRDPDVLADWKYPDEPRVEGLLRIPGKLSPSPLPELEFDPDVSHWPADRVSDYNWTDEDCARWFPKIDKNPLWKRKRKARARQRSPWEEAIRSAPEGDAQPYSREIQFSPGNKLIHPSYGVGVVIAVRGDRVDVMFPDDKLRVFLHRAP
jgi:hypothetical protein